MKKVIIILNLVFICALVVVGIFVFTNRKDKQTTDLYSTPYEFGHFKISYMGSEFHSDEANLEVSIVIEYSGEGDRRFSAHNISVKIINGSTSEDCVYFQEGDTVGHPSGVVTINKNNSKILSFSETLYYKKHQSGGGIEYFRQKLLSEDVKFELIYSGKVLARFKPIIL